MGDREIEAALRQIRPDKTDAFPLGALNGIRVLRGYLEELEPRCIERSLELGASVEDVADALGITKQGVYYKIRRIAEQGDATLDAEGDEAVSG
jgi:transcriptional regulator with PAS, ATPase and Fis domain